MSEQLNSNSPREAFERNEEVIAKIKKGNLRPRYEAMEDLFKEISELVKTVLEDRPVFAAIPRFNIINIDSLEDRLLALIYCYGRYVEVALDKSEAKKLWDELEPQAQQLKRLVIETIQFLCAEEGDTKRLKEINEIAIGAGRKDLFCDYSKLTHITKRELESLISMGVQQSIADDMQKVFEELIPLFGSIDSSPEEVEKRALLVQQAYTWLDEAVSEIRRYGKFAFRHDEVKQARYKSNKMVAMGKASSKSRTEESNSALE